MKKRLYALLCACLLSLCLSACGGQDEVSSAAPQSQESEAAPPQSQSLPEESPASEAPASSGAQSEGEQSAQEAALVLVQQDSGAEAGYEPTLTLYQDGSFQLAATFYDGTALITGTYTQEEGVYVLAPTESTAQGVAGSDVGEMRLSPSGEGYTYSGGQLGLTFDGASFLPEGA
ncbi:MAG: hypothetical protein ACLRS7_13120 [Acutalibacter sp.]